MATTSGLLRVLRSQWFRASLGLTVVAIAFAWALPSIAPYGEVFSRLGDLSAGYLLAIALVGTANLLAPAASQRAALPGLRFRDAVASDWTTSAITNTLPGGSAVAIGLTWSMYRSYGLDNGPIARSMIVTGVWDTFVKFGTPLLALAWLSTERPVGPGLVQAALVGSALFLVVIGLGLVLLSGGVTITRIGGLLDRLPLTGTGWPERLASLRADTISLLRERWPSLTFWTLAGHTNLYVLLLLCLRAVGVTSIEATAAAVLAAFAFGRLVTALPVSPGGLGVMEVSLTGALATVGSADEATVVAAVLLFRFLTFLVPIPLGAISWLFWSGRELKGEQTGDSPARRPAL